MPSTARPAPPRPRYVMPTFGWERNTEGNPLTSRRRGHGLRVYLDRAWFSSGDGELLGVVIWPGGLSDGDCRRLKGLISQAGADPIVVSAGRVNLTRHNLTTEGITWGSRLSLPGLDGGERVDVAGHPVAYDAERDLWYCDIGFDPDIGRHTEAYGALARLALVRFQPNSLSGLEVSRPVTTEFMQVAPDRSAVVTFDPDDPASPRLAVAGQTYQATLGEGGQPRVDGTFVQVTVEERRPDLANELGWRPAEADAAQVEGDAVQAAATLLWQGRIRLPADRRPGQFRLVIKEFEPWLDDTALASASAAEVGPRARRLVYSEIFNL